MVGPNWLALWLRNLEGGPARISHQISITAGDMLAISDVLVGRASDIPFSMPPALGPAAPELTGISPASLRNLVRKAG